MKVLEWTADEGQRLDVFLRARLPDMLGAAGEAVSNGKIRRLIVAGAVQVDGVQRRVPAFMLRRGSRVSARIDEDKFFFEKQPDDISFELTEKDVLFEDDALIVVNKPPFLPTEETVVKGRANMHQAVVDYLWKKNPSLRNPPYAGIMHRLDRGTSGVLLFTKLRTVNAAVHDMFELHTARKTYRAVCTLQRGAALPPERFSVDTSIGRVSPKSSACRMGAVPESRGGLSARTDFRIAGSRDGLIYVEACPLTGRTHQIRTHLSLSGLPIAGDVLYGGRDGLASCGGRIMLHAFRLEFPHPEDGRTLCVEAPLPPGFSADA